jgi:serine/threonine-protein kinase/endoribonuclease IRE1
MRKTSTFCRFLVLQISDMGLGKQLLTGQSSFGASSIAHPSTLTCENTSLAGPGSVGWTAPEVMVLRSKDHMRSEADSVEDIAAPASNLTSRSVDIFSLGCIFYCTLLPGFHPFGEWYEREANIMRSSPKTQALEEVSAEASALVNSMISRDPRLRPTANEICSHPFFWKPSKRLSFLSDFSDRVELQSDNLERNFLVVRVETNAAAVTGLSWDKALDSDLISNVSRFRTYDPSSVRDLLRMIRNKYHHFCELPDSVKDKIGYSLDDLLHYFESKFPLLLMHCYNLCRDFLPSEDSLIIKYGIVSHSTTVKIASSQGVGQINGGSTANGGSSCKVPTLVDGSIETLSEVFMPKTENEDAASILGVSADTSFCFISEFSGSSLEVASNYISHESIPADIVIWEGSSTAKLLNCRGWMRSEEQWMQRTDALARKRDVNIVRCVEDPKFRTRLCNHWDISKGTYCSMRKKNKCIFAHGPVELRVKEGKRQRWGTLVDEQGDNNNPFHSGGEDTYGAARSIECKRKEDGQWVSEKNKNSKSGQKPRGKLKEKEKGKLNV